MSALLVFFVWARIVSRKPHVIEIDLNDILRQMAGNSPCETGNTNVDWVVAGALGYSQRELASQRKWIWYRRKGKNAPLQFMDVIQQTWSDEAIRRSDTAVLRRWKITVDSIEEIAPDSDMGIEQKICWGLFIKLYNYATAEFSIKDGNPCLRVGWDIGRLYGRGFEFEIEKRNATVVLKNPKMLWVS